MLRYSGRRCFNSYPLSRVLAFKERFLVQGDDATRARLARDTCRRAFVPSGQLTLTLTHILTPTLTLTLTHSPPPPPSL